MEELNIYKDGYGTNKYKKYGFSPKKIKILQYISRFAEEHHRCATQQEIANHFNNAISTINQHLQELHFSVGDRKSWKKNKDELMKQWKCPCCGKNLIKN